MDKVVLITGADRGIGKAIALKFAQEGWKVAINYVANENAALETAKETGGKIYPADVSSREEVSSMFHKIEAELGPVSVLVNNAGISVVGLFQDITEEEWDKLFGINVKGLVNCSREALKNMISEKSGSIVNVSSIWGVCGGSCETHYSATKAAVIGYTKSMAKELGPSGIRVNCVAPGTIDTDMNAHLTEEDRNGICEETPLERIGTPAEVAEAVYFLSSDKASYITGAVLGVNGGFVI